MTGFRKIYEKFGSPAVSLRQIGAYEPRWFMYRMHMNPDEAVRSHLELLIFLMLLHALYYYLVRRFHAFDARLLITSCAVAMFSVVAAWLGIGLGACLVILMLAPTVTVVGYELLGYRQADAIGDY